MSKIIENKNVEKYRKYKCRKSENKNVENHRKLKMQKIMENKNV